MSDIQSRPSPSQRGRGLARGGRGGSFGGRSGGGARGARGSSFAANGVANESFEDQGEIGKLMKQYANQLAPLKELFPDWTPEDIVFALNENNGDVQLTAEKISEGFASQWGEVKKKNKDRARSKAKEPANKDADSFHSARPARGPRTSYDGAGRGGRGGRGGSDRGRGGIRGGRGGALNGGRPGKPQGDEFSAGVGDSWGGPAAIPANAWGESSSSAVKDDTSGWNEATDDSSFGWGSNDKKEDTVAPLEKPAPKPAVVPKPTAPAVPKTSWASLLKPAPPPPAPVQKKPAPSPPKPAPEPVEAPKEPEPVVEPTPKPVPEPTPEVVEEPAEPEVKEPEPVEELAPAAEPEITETPQKLTEDNLEKIEDIAPPAPTGTAASTVATTTERGTESSTPQIPVAVPPSAPKQQAPVSKGTPGRAAFRRVLDQQEGVVMPGNHTDVGRAALQFGSMGLGDEEDEEPETPEPAPEPAQPSPPPPQPAATSLPPTGPSASLPASQAPNTESIPTPRQAPGLPSQPQPQNIPFQSNNQPPLGPQSMTHQVHPHFAAQYGRYGTQESQAKPFDSFAQQHTPTQAPSQPQQTQQPPTHPSYGTYMQNQPSHIGIGVSSAPEQVPQYNYYTERSQPPGFGQGYAAAYMQNQLAQSQQEAGAAQQRASSGLGGGSDSVQIPSSVSGPGQVQQPTSRYGAPAGDQASHGTPSPALPVQQTTQAHNMAQSYPMQYHPYYNQFMQQQYYGSPAPYGGKGMFGYPQHYMSPGYGDHSSSPGAVGGFGQPSVQGRDSMSSSLGDYNRMNSTGSQQGLPQHSSAGGYGNGIPNFLGSRALPQEQQQLGTGVGQQQTQQGQADDMKFGENKPPTGPSAAPSLQGQPGRPGSATSGTGLGGQQGNQPSGIYGGHLNPGLGQQQQQQHQQQHQTGYGVGQGQNANQYSMYSGGYPSYPQGSGRHGAGWAYGH